MMSKSSAGSASQTTKRFSSDAAVGPSRPRLRHRKPAKIRPNTGSRISRVDNIGEAGRQAEKRRFARVVVHVDTIKYCFGCPTILFLHRDRRQTATLLRDARRDPSFRSGCGAAQPVATA